LATHPENEELQIAYDAALRKLESSQLPKVHPQVILKTFNLADIPENTSVSILSGGQKTRLGLALLLLNEPDVLILDEPTNHLDILMLEWLEEWINKFEGGALIVSHDRTFLDNTVNRILDLDPITHTIKGYRGNYSQYLEQYLHAQEKQLSAYRDQVYEIRHMRQDIARTKRQAYHVEQTTTSREPNPRRYAKKVARKAKSREKKLDRFLNSDERVDKPIQSWQMKLEFQVREHQSQDVLRLENLSVGYPNHNPLIKGLNMYVRSGARIVLTGPNASGKTTLLRTIVGHLEPIAGKIYLGSGIRIGYMAQEQESLPDDLNALETIQSHTPIDETEARSFLHYFLFSGDDVLLPLKNLSSGERSRLELAILVVKGCDFLLLDEPINHLDIPSRSRFEQALSQFNGTVLAVVHDRYFIQRFAGELWILDDSGTLKVNSIRTD
ncbi:MAG: ABC-F family ATP-binding cassette domain-containing protein, partial [Chloroflexi bacterium]|nr:ABC-F family ATP-binding cassette domain-containing protein [Chloroflexota bacterium]